MKRFFIFAIFTVLSLCTFGQEAITSPIVSNDPICDITCFEKLLINTGRYEEVPGYKDRFHLKNEQPGDYLAPTFIIIMDETHIGFIIKTNVSNPVYIVDQVDAFFRQKVYKTYTPGEMPSKEHLWLYENNINQIGLSRTGSAIFIVVTIK